MFVRVVPGQHEYRWCPRCRDWSALDVGVYAPADRPELIGTFPACETCDPDLFTEPTNDQKEVGGG